eukprot:gene7130-9729_t
MKSVGLIGVGHMGVGMAINILRKGQTIGINKLMVHDINVNNTIALRSKLVAHPSNVILEVLPIDESLSTMAASCDLIALSLPNQASCEQVLFGSHGLFSTPNESNADIKSNSCSKVLRVLDHSTLTPTFAKMCQTKILQLNKQNRNHKQAIYLDCPVSGGPQGAENGTLTTMVGGDAHDVTDIEPFLKLYSTNVKHFGPVGTGMSAKLINQMLVGVHIQAAVEALYMAEKLGITDNNILILKDMLSTSWGHSRMQDLIFSDYIKANENNSKNWDIIINNTAAPLRNIEKDFSYISKELQGSTGGINVLPTANAASNSIETACSEKYNYNNSAFLSLIHLLRK